MDDLTRSIREMIDGIGTRPRAPHSVDSVDCVDGIGGDKSTVLDTSLSLSLSLPAPPPDLPTQSTQSTESQPDPSDHRVEWVRVGADEILEYAAARYINPAVLAARLGIGEDELRRRLGHPIEEDRGSSPLPAERAQSPRLVYPGE